MTWRLLFLLTGGVQPLGNTGHHSGIAKTPVDCPRWLGYAGLEDDEQGDRKRHGGPDKAVHHYAFDHYPYWLQAIGPRPALSQPGAFGENLVTTGVTENDVCVGDIFQLGRAVVQVSQTRQPCWKLNVRFDVADMATRVQQTGRTGWYYRVLTPGYVEPDARLELIERRYSTWPLSRLLDVLYRRTGDAEALVFLAKLQVLPQSWRDLFARRAQSGIVEDWSKRLFTPGEH